MTNDKLNKNWIETINAYAITINNDFLIKDILASTNVEDLVDKKLYITSKNEYIINYLNTNNLELSKLYNSINNDDVSIIALNKNDWKDLKSNNYDQSVNEDKNNYLDKNINFENYVIGNFNRNAYAIIKEILNLGNSDFNPIFIYSATGLGKTHLTSAFANAYKNKFPDKKVYYIDATYFSKDVYEAFQKGSNYVEEFKKIFCSYDVLILEDIQFLADKTKTNEILFQIFNHFINNKKILIMTADKNPEKLLGFEERMISRFSSGITITIKNPDEEVVKNIIKETIRNTKLIINDESIKLIYKWFNNDIRILIGAINKIIFMSNINSSYVIDENIIKDILDIESRNNNLKSNPKNNDEKYINPGNIINSVAKLYNVSNQDIIGTTRKKEIVNARHLIMYVLKQVFNMPYKEIGMLLGNRDHTTVMNGVEKTKELIEKDKNLLNVIDNIVKKI